jgi:hypothetical protein
MEVSDRQDFGGASPSLLTFIPKLYPAVEGGAQERKCGRGHLLMLLFKVGRNQAEVPGEPVFVA